jgi:hypothetical protein
VEECPAPTGRRTAPAPAPAPSAPATALPAASAGAMRPGESVTCVEPTSSPSPALSPGPSHSLPHCLFIVYHCTRTHSPPPASGQARELDAESVYGYTTSNQTGSGNEWPSQGGGCGEHSWSTVRVWPRPCDTRRTSSSPARCCGRKPGLSRPARMLVMVRRAPVMALNAAATRTICPPPSSCAPSTVRCGAGVDFLSERAVRGSGGTGAAVAVGGAGAVAIAFGSGRGAGRVAPEDSASAGAENCGGGSVEVDGGPSSSPPAERQRRVPRPRCSITSETPSPLLPPPLGADAGADVRVRLAGVWTDIGQEQGTQKRRLDLSREGRSDDKKLVKKTNSLNFASLSPNAPCAAHKFKHRTLARSINVGFASHTWTKCAA